MIVDVLELPYLAPESEAEQTLERVVALVADNLRHGRPMVSKEQASALGLDQLDAKSMCQSWSDTVFQCTSDLFYALHRAGVAADDIPRFLPRVQMRNVERDFRRRDSGSLPYKSQAPLRQRAFALGLFGRYQARLVADRVRADFGLCFEGGVDCPWVAPAPLRYLDGFPRVAPVSDAEQQWEQVVQCIGQNLRDHGEFDARRMLSPALYGFLGGKNAAPNLRDMFQRVFCSYDGFTPADDAQIRALVAQSSGPSIDWKGINRAIPHQTGLRVILRWKDVLSKQKGPAVPSSSGGDGVLHQQRLLRGLFCHHRVPIDHPYWRDLLGYDVDETIGSLPAAPHTATTPPGAGPYPEPGRGPPLGPAAVHREGAGRGPEEEHGAEGPVHRPVGGRVARAPAVQARPHPPQGLEQQLVNRGALRGTRAWLVLG